MPVSLPTCTLVTHTQALGSEAYTDFIHTCIQGGVDAVQLREKHLPYADLLDFGKTLKTCLDACSIPLIINDHVALCAELDTAGVHLGQSDGDVSAARKRLGKDKIIGLTVDNLEQLKTANQLPIDYIGIGAIFPSQSKPNVQTHWGITGLCQALALSKHPIIAIGGIDTQNVSAVWQTGVHGIAAIAAFHQAACPETAARILSRSPIGVRT